MSHFYLLINVCEEHDVEQEIKIDPVKQTVEFYFIHREKKLAYRQKYSYCRYNLEFFNMLEMFSDWILDDLTKGGLIGDKGTVCKTLE